MKIQLVIQPISYKPIRFCEYTSIGEAIHIGISLKQHQNFKGEIWVESTSTLTESVVARHPQPMINRYEIPAIS